MKVIQNKTGISPTELIAVAERENNQKRNYLLVNRYQGKHVPVSPSASFSLFQALGQEMYPDYLGKTVTFIGFAETATAIGAKLAVDFPGEAYYLTTTREQVEGTLLVDFQEEHSHAVEQKLYCQDVERFLQGSDCICFVEDEVTTGKTILNFIEKLEEQGVSKQFAVASIVNSMSGEQETYFKEMKIPLYYLLRLENNFATVAFSEKTIEDDTPTLSVWESNTTIVQGGVNPRLGIHGREYESACEELWKGLETMLGGTPDTQRVLVLGTEECMYPALFCGAQLEKKFPEWNVFTHATTRSPIVPRREDGYPLESRCQLESVYQKNRSTFLYNLASYDLVVIITDAENINQPGLSQLEGTLQSFGNRDIFVMKWGK